MEKNIKLVKRERYRKLKLKSIVGRSISGNKSKKTRI